MVLFCFSGDKHAPAGWHWLSQRQQHAQFTGLTGDVYRWLQSVPACASPVGSQNPAENARNAVFCTAIRRLSAESPALRFCEMTISA